MSKLISQSFKGGNSDLLNSCLDKEVELIINNDKIAFQNLSASQAKPILSSFFKKNSPLSFDYVYQGANRSALQYCIGNYKSNNSNYLVNMPLRKDKDDRFWLILCNLKRSENLRILYKNKYI
jgi:hypothetical protein